MAKLKSKQTAIATVRNYLRTLASFPTTLIFHRSLPLTMCFAVPWSLSWPFQVSLFKSFGITVKGCSRIWKCAAVETHVKSWSFKLFRGATLPCFATDIETMAMAPFVQYLLPTDHGQIKRRRTKKGIAGSTIFFLAFSLEVHSSVILTAVSQRVSPECRAWNRTQNLPHSRQSCLPLIYATPSLAIQRIHAITIGQAWGGGKEQRKSQRDQSRMAPADC
jgi:hypothetical protein